MIKLIYNKVVGSTNDQANKCNEEWSLFLAEEQTKGRGQKGNHWESEAGKNLTFSLLIKPDFIHASSQFYISKAISLAICDTLCDYGINSKIKWPNDIYVGDKKICGVLIENDLSMSGVITKAIIGIGLNVNQEQFTSDAPNPISMKLLLGKDIDRNKVLNELCKQIFTYYNYLLNNNFDLIDRFYINKLYRFQQTALYRNVESQTIFRGTIIDVKKGGMLMVKNEDGEECGFLFKEIEYI